jgi:N-acetylglucosaminyl-diphospho-decaprenol L-rhamnosyltransferase
VHDLAVIIVSTDQADWLPACLPTVVARSGPISLDLVVVDNGSTRATRDLVERDFPDVRTLVVPNHGFAHANNEALKTVDSRYVLFLNPDTEVLEGTFAELLAELDARPDVGLAGVRQLGPDGRVYPTMRRFPNVARTLGDAFGLERLAARPASLGERELDGDRYDREFASDWTIGSFMLVRRDALTAIGGFDERFFVYSEEVDLRLRIRQAGWTIVHLPALTILHHGSDARTVDVRMATQNAYAQLQYADKHFRAAHRVGYRAALLLRYGLRSVPPVGDARRRSAARAAAALVLGRLEPPFGRGPR